MKTSTLCPTPPGLRELAWNVALPGDMRPKLGPPPDAFWLEVAKRPKTNLYVIRRPDTGSLKIGVSGDVLKRFKTLCHGNDVLLELGLHFPALPYHEIEIHKEFRAHRKCGEWFYPAPAIIEWLGHQSLVSGVVVVTPFWRAA